MAVAFDTLGFARKLTEGGVDRAEAEAHADAARDFIMADVVTKSDLERAIDRLTLQMTVRLGGLMALGMSVMTAVLGFVLKH